MPSKRRQDAVKTSGVVTAPTARNAKRHKTPKPAASSSKAKTTHESERALRFDRLDSMKFLDFYKLKNRDGLTTTDLKMLNQTIEEAQGFAPQGVRVLDPNKYMKFCENRELTTLPGFKWDEGNHVVVAEDSVWDTYRKACSYKVLTVWLILMS